MKYLSLLGYECQGLINQSKLIIHHEIPTSFIYSYHQNGSHNTDVNDNIAGQG